MSITYEGHFTLRHARAIYFETNGFGDGGYTKKWVPVKVGPVEFVIPNTASRVRAVRLHDLHHIATEYPTHLRGEAWIGAWELGSGCTDHVAAWILNASSFGYGVFLTPRRLWHAFVRGRHSQNLYDREFDDGLLDGTVDALRRELRLDEVHRSRASDAAWFAVWTLVGASLAVGSVPLLLLVTVAQASRRRPAA